MVPDDGKEGLNSGWTYRDRVDAGAAGLRALDYYAERYPHSTRQQWRQRLQAGLIRCTGAPVGADDELEQGQELVYRRPPWREPDVPLDIGISYVDKDLIVARKPAGLPVLPAGGEYLEHTMLAIIRARYAGDQLPPAPIHRLGRGTSGLIMFARSAAARRILSVDMRERRIGKRYRALVQGHPHPDNFSIEEPIGLIPYPGFGHVHAATADGKESRSEVHVRERIATGDTLVDVDIPTGRPHQIRIHLACAGHPVVGEPLYVAGGRPRSPTSKRRLSLPGDCGYRLHAMRLQFTHPRTAAVMAVYCRPPEGLLMSAETDSEVTAIVD